MCGLRACASTSELELRLASRLPAPVSLDSVQLVLAVRSPPDALRRRLLAGDLAEAAEESGRKALLFALSAGPVLLGPGEQCLRLSNAVDLQAERGSLDGAGADDAVPLRMLRRMSLSDARQPSTTSVDVDAVEAEAEEATESVAWLESLQMASGPLQFECVRSEAARFPNVDLSELRGDSFSRLCPGVRLELYPEQAADGALVLGEVQLLPAALLTRFDSLASGTLILLSDGTLVFPDDHTITITRRTGAEVAESRVVMRGGTKAARRRAGRASR